MKVGKEYVFDTPSGRKTLADLFDGRSQLPIYHFILGPGQKAGCLACSLLADGFDGVLPHLENHDVAFVTVSRAPLTEIDVNGFPTGARLTTIPACPCQPGPKTSKCQV